MRTISTTQAALERVVHRNRLVYINGQLERCPSPRQVADHARRRWESEVRSVDTARTSVLWEREPMPLHGGHS